MSYIAERRQEEKDRRRNEIIDAAEALYREVGWDAVTMDAVARRARLSRALVYVYFQDKTDLHFAIAIRAIDELTRRFAEAADGARTGAEKMLAIGQHKKAPILTPNSEFPKILVPADINQANMGGWSRYPSAKC